MGYSGKNYWHYLLKSHPLSYQLLLLQELLCISFNCATAAGAAAPLFRSTDHHKQIKGGNRPLQPTCACRWLSACNVWLGF